MGIIVAWLLAAYFAPLPHDPLQPNPSATHQPPSSEYWFGTDYLGFDVFSRTVTSARLDIPLALGGTVLAMLIGVTLGLLGSGKGRMAELVMRALDVFQAFPVLVIGLVLVTMMGDNLASIIIAIAMVHTPRFVRITRSQGLALKESRFVEAAISIGASDGRVLARHILPNLVGVIAAAASLAAAHGIVLIAGLTFLGVGITPPAASWGAMIRVGADGITAGEWWPLIAPGLAIIITVASFNAIAQHALQRFETLAR